MIKGFAIHFRDLPVDTAWQVQTLMNSLVINMKVDQEEARRAFVVKSEPSFSGCLRRRGDPFASVNGGAVPPGPAT